MSDKFISASKIREMLGIDPDGDCDKCEHWGRFGCGRNDVELACAVIDICPAADVRPVVSGSWIEATDYNGDTYYICPACEDEFVLTDGTLADNHYFFCPNCGADMRNLVEIDQVKEDKT